MSRCTPFILSGEFTIYRAAEIRAELVAALATCEQGLEIDLAAVTEIDSAGVQLLIAASSTARTTGRRVVLGAASEPVREVLALLGLGDSFDTPDVEVAAPPQQLQGETT